MLVTVLRMDKKPAYAIDHPIFTLTTIIKIGKDRSATGFFFSDKDSLYLVTNKHVIYGTDFKEPLIARITIVLHSDPSNSTKNDEVVIELLNGDGTKKWLEHSNPDVDVILIPLKLDAEKYIFSTMNRSFIDDVKDLVVLFEKILVVGYPYGWYDDINNLPIVRVGFLSSPFKVGFKGKPVMVGDVTTHPGMSGGPVIMYLRDPLTKTPGGLQINFASKFLLIGVYSGQFKIPQKPKQRPNLINIWFPETIEEILDANQPDQEINSINSV